MESRPRKIRFYRDAHGRNHFDEWFQALEDRASQQRINQRLDRLVRGLFGDSRNLPGGIRELRLDFGPGYRLYFGEDGTVVVVLVIGGDKQSQSRDIVFAQAAWADYLRRSQR